MFLVLTVYIKMFFSVSINNPLENDVLLELSTIVENKEFVKSQPLVDVKKKINEIKQNEKLFSLKTLLSLR